MHEVIMPKLGLTMESGVIEKWHKKEGDKIEEGEVLFEVMTDKVSLEVESYHSGILKKIVRKEGEEVPVTEIVAYIGKSGEELPQEEVKDAKEMAEEKEEKEELEEKEMPSEDIKKIKISPLARKIAKDKNVDMSKITGTGPGGRIVKEDIENYIKSLEEKEPARIKISPLARKTAKELGVDYIKEPIEGTGPEGRIIKDDITSYAKTKEEKVKEKPLEEAAQEGKLNIKSSTPLKGIRKVIAEKMSYSKKNIPHLVINAVASASNLIELRERLKDKISSIYGIKITYTDFLLKICAVALRENIKINSSYQDENHIIYEDVNVGLAVAIEDGLIVPTLYNCDKLGILDIARKRAELVEKAREGKLNLEEITNGTFTITNLGMFKIRSLSAIINPPQAAILGVGEIYSAPSAVDGKIEVRSFMELSLSCDHRIIDGALAAKFLQRAVELIENPEMLVI